VLVAVMFLAACGKSEQSPDANPDLAAVPAMLRPDHASVALASSVGCAAPAVAMVRIQNAGGAPSGTLAVSVTAPFALGAGGCQNTVLAPGQTCDVEVRFVPPSLGSVTGTLTFVATPGGQIIVALTGDGFIREAPNPWPSTLDFGELPVGATSEPRMVMLANTGSAPSQPIETSVSGADFASVTDSCNHAVLQPAQSCAVSVVFRPASVGFKNGTVLVQTSDACGPSSATVSMAGNGLLPPDGGASDGP
jgi:hypothetical protein